MLNPLPKFCGTRLPVTTIVTENYQYALPFCPFCLLQIHHCWVVMKWVPNVSFHRVICTKGFLHRDCLRRKPCMKRPKMDRSGLAHMNQSGFFKEGCSSIPGGFSGQGEGHF